MGGTVGHLNHLYDNRELTFGEMKSILRTASEGKLERATEKMDGQQLTFTFDLSTNKLLGARSTGDIKRGGLDSAALADKFKDRGSVEAAFVTAFKVLDGAIGALPDKTKRQVFGPASNRWYSMEIIYTKNPNVINYDSDSIVFHGWPIFKRDTRGDVSMVEDDAGGVDVLTQNIERMQKAVTHRGWQVRGPSIVSMKAMSDGSALETVLGEINAAMSEAGVGDSDTMGDFMLARSRDSAKQLGMNPEVTEMIALRVSETPGAPTLIDIKKKLKKVDYDIVNKFVKNSADLMRDIVRPIELAINNFAVVLLQGLSSTLIADTGGEVKRLRDEVSSAIKAIQASGDESAMSVLARQLEKLKGVENITSPMEGVVFIYKGKAYKFTGSFASGNAILGIFKYGRGVTAAKENFDFAEYETFKHSVLLTETHRRKLVKEANLSAFEMTKRPRRWDIFLQKIQDGTAFSDVEGRRFMIPDAGNEALIDALKSKDPEAYKQAFSSGIKTVPDVSILSPTQLKKTAEFGGKEPGQSLAKENIQIAQIQTAIDEKSPVDINVGRKIANNVVAIKSVKGTPKADAFLLDWEEKIVAALSLKDADTPEQMQQWGGISRLTDHPEIYNFIEDIKAIQDHMPAGRINIAYYRQLEDEELARKLCYGDRSSKENDCDVIIASQQPIQINDAGDFVASNVFYAPQIPPGDWAPTLWATYREGRGGASGIKNVRIGCYPKKWGLGRKNIELPRRSKDQSTT